MSYEQCCQILDVDPTMDIETVKKAYRAKAREWHPDMHVGESQENLNIANRAMQDINEAYTTLSENYYENSAKNNQNTATQNDNTAQEAEMEPEVKTVHVAYEKSIFDERMFMGNEQRAKAKREQHKDLYDSIYSRFSKREKPNFTEEQKQNATWKNRNVYSNMVSKIYERYIFEVLLGYMDNKYQDLDIASMIEQYILSLSEMSEKGYESPFGRSA